MTRFDLTPTEMQCVDCTFTVDTSTMSERRALDALNAHECTNFIVAHCIYCRRPVSPVHQHKTHYYDWDMDEWEPGTWD